MKPWKWTLLVFELALFAIILILPQVDLPDFTFHGGTAPVAAKSRFSVALARTVLPTAVRMPLPQDLSDEVATKDFEVPAAPSLNVRLSLLRTLIC
jgi:hypothetical protein